MKSKWYIPMLMLAAALWPATTRAVKVADIARLRGERTYLLSGMGLVVGLKGSGDPGEFMPAIRPLAKALEAYSNPGTVRDLVQVKNVALVWVTVAVPKEGVREGDQLDVHVSSMGAASSLKGGRLFVTPLGGSTPEDLKTLYATAEGAITLEDPSDPLRGVVKKGATMELDVSQRVIADDGRISLILEPHAAAWTTASTIAKIVNDAEGTGETLAVAENDKVVSITIPLNERSRPTDFVARIMQLPVRIVATEARVVINQDTGTIVVTGDVEISPCVVTHQGLTITTVAPAPVPTPRTPVTTERTTLALDTTKQGGAKLQELLDALDAIKVPAQERIAIIRELHESGSLHAKLIEQGQK